MEPDLKNEWPEEYLNFLSDFKTTVEEELFDTKEEMVAKTKEIYMKNKNDVGAPTRINTNFGARLSYLESKWVKEVLLQHLDLIKGKTLSSEDKKLAASLIDLANSERIDLMKIEEKKPLRFSVDVINWKKNKFKESIKNLKMPEKSVKFLMGKSQASIINSFQKRFDTYEANDFYNAAMDFIQPRKHLLHSIIYED